MDVVTTDTCINYQTVYQPHLGEHVAWGDTGTVIYANSVFGARSNFESGPAALAAALTGRTPEYGFHLDEHRRGSFTVELKAELDDLADWGAVGKLVGEAHQNYYAVPVFHGYHRTPDGRRAEAPRRGARELRLDGHVPLRGRDARSAVDRSCPGRQAAEDLSITDAKSKQSIASYSLGDGDARLVVFSGPQQSLFEMKQLADLFSGKKVKAGVDLLRHHQLARCSRSRATSATRRRWRTRA